MHVVLDALVNVTTWMQADIQALDAADYHFYFQLLLLFLFLLLLLSVVFILFSGLLFRQ